jgi:hypothetical protein
VPVDNNGANRYYEIGYLLVSFSRKIPRSKVTEWYGQGLGFERLTTHDFFLHFSLIVSYSPPRISTHRRAYSRTLLGLCVSGRVQDNQAKASSTTDLECVGGKTCRLH